MTDMEAMYLLFCFFAFVRGNNPSRVPKKCSYIQNEGAKFLKKLFGVKALNFNEKEVYRDYKLLIRDNSSYILKKKLRLAVSISGADLTEKKYRFIGEIEKLIYYPGTPTGIEKELIDKLIMSWKINRYQLENFLNNQKRPFPNQKFKAIRTDP